MAEAVHKTGNGVLVDKYAQKTALRLGVTPDAVRAEFKKLSRGQPLDIDDSEAAGPEAQLEPPGPAEYRLLKLLLLDDELVAWAAAHVDPGWIRHPVARDIVARRIAAHSNSTWTNLPVFLEQFEDAQARDLISQATTEDRPLPNPSQQMVDVTLRLRNQFLDLQLAQLLRQLGQPELSENSQMELLKQQQALREAKRQPLA